MSGASNLVLVVGDTHGVLTRSKECVDEAVRVGASRVLQVGDFGWFPHLSDGSCFIAGLDEYCAEAGIEWFFIAGNHDNWDDLEDLAVSEDADDSGAHVVGVATRYIPRPHRWVWEGRTFGALGGAWSIDGRQRIAHVSIWPQEEPTYANAEQLVGGGDLDVLVCHDAPGAVDLSVASWSGNDSGGGRSTRTLIDLVVRATRPRLVFHGHWHWRHTTPVESGSVVEGLGDHLAALRDQCVLLNLETLEVSPPSTPLPTRAPFA